MSESRTGFGLPSTFWVLFSGTLINRAASFVSVFLALHLTQDLGLTERTAGWIVGTWGMGAWLASPIAGVLADRVGRKATMLLGLIPGGCAVLAIAFAENVPLLFALCFFGGATQQMYFPASSAAIADLVPAADRQRAYGLIYWAVNLGLGIGFVIGGLVPEKYLWLLFVADAATTFIAAGLTAWRVPETRPKDIHHEAALAGLLRVARDRVFMTFAMLHLFMLVIFGQFQLALPLDMRAHGLDSRSFAWLMAFNCLGVVVLQPWLAPRLRKYDSSRLLAISAALTGIGYGFNMAVPWIAGATGGGTSHASASWFALYPWLAHALTGGIHVDTWCFALYLVGAAFWTVAEVVGFPVAAALVANLAPVALRGRYQGAFSMLWGGASSLAPILGGTGLGLFGGSAFWLTCLGVGTAVALGHLAAAPARRARLQVVETAAS